MKTSPLTAVALIVNFTACANDVSTINPNDPTIWRMADDKCVKAADAATTPGEENYAYFKRCMKQYGYNLYIPGENANAIIASNPNPTQVYSGHDVPAPPAQGPGKVQIERRGGAYYVPVRINDTITIPFILDTGASDLAIPADVALTLMRAGALRRGDFLGRSPYQIANGAEEISDVVIIRKVQVGEHVVRNVTASINPPDASLCLVRASCRNSGL
jgi:hypothetical protein